MIKDHKFRLLLTLVLFFLGGCSSLPGTIPPPDHSPSIISPQPSPDPVPTSAAGIDEQETDPIAAVPTGEFTQEVAEEEIMVQADVISVESSGTPGSYQFSVGILSPDSGCEQYADWWEVLSEDGQLIYRRVLLHSHVNEQPFSRSGGPIGIDADTVVLIRAHMNQAGYGGIGMKGSVSKGFSPADLPTDFAPGVEEEPPLPTGCNF